MPITESESARVARLAERVSRDPSSALFLPLAEAYRQQGRVAAAESVLRAGLRQHKEHFSARTALGRVLLQLERPEEAAVELERVHRAVPDNLLAASLLEEARARQAPAAPTVTPAEQGPASAPAGLVRAHGPVVPDSPGPRQATPHDEPPLNASLPAPDPSVQRRVAALRRFLVGATSLRGHHA